MATCRYGLTIEQARGAHRGSRPALTRECRRRQGRGHDGASLPPLGTPAELSRVLPRPSSARESAHCDGPRQSCHYFKRASVRQKTARVLSRASAVVAPHSPGASGTCAAFVQGSSGAQACPCCPRADRLSDFLRAAGLTSRDPRRIAVSAAWHCAARPRAWHAMLLTLPGRGPRARGRHSRCASTLASCRRGVPLLRARIRRAGDEQRVMREAVERAIERVARSGSLPRAGRNARFRRCSSPRGERRGEGI